MSTSHELHLALSPYSLALREPCAMAALVLGTRVVTMMPEPASGRTREDVAAAVERAPRFLRLMESFRWSAPLWKSGVVSGGVGSERSYEEFERVRNEVNVRSERGGTGAGKKSGRRGEVRDELTRAVKVEERAASAFDDKLDLIAADILRGGPDPSINVPLTSALDRFAARHRYTVVRPAPAPTGGGSGQAQSRAGRGSMVQRAEMRLGEKRFAVAIPMLLRGGGRQLLKLRERLEPELLSLRHELAAMILDMARSTNGRVGPGAPASLRRAALAYSEAFQELYGHPLGDDEHGERVVAGSVSVVGIELPIDGAARAAALAARSAKGLGRRAAMSGVSHPPEAPAKMLVLAIREMSARPIATQPIS